MSYRKTSNCTAVDCIRKIKRRYECHKLNSEQIKTYKSNASKLSLLFEYAKEWFDVKKIIVVDKKLENKKDKNITVCKCLDDDEIDNRTLVVTLSETLDVVAACMEKHCKQIEFAELLSLYEQAVECEYRIPRIINTIENSFSEFYIYGDTLTALNLLSYLEQNDNIKVHKVNIDDLIQQNAELEQKDRIVIIADLLPYSVGDHITAPIVHWRKMGSGGEVMNGQKDIEINILPALRELGVECISVSTPRLSKMLNRPDVLFSIFKFKKIRKKNMTDFITSTNNHFNTEDLTDEHLDVKTVCSKGYAELFHNGEKVNYENGFRRTVGSKAVHKRRVWLYGPCLVLGSYVSDENTIPSLLQKMLGEEYLILNRGQPNAYGLNLLMRSADYRAGDIVLYVRHDSGNTSKADFDLIQSYKKINNLSGHISDSLMHCDSVVNKQIAEDFFDIVKRVPNRTQDCGMLRFGSQIKRIPELYMLRNDSFEEYIRYIRQFKLSGRNGAIVMNCNPFTKGHLYLITEAAQKVDNLYIFVVEENRSYFPFEDRYALVKEGTSHLENVCVLKSGKFVISSTTLPGYFEKDQLGDVYLDASNDLLLFLQIAKELNISVRFAGHEPLDRFTAQYNLNMRSVLEKYGVDFCEIDRKKAGDEYISASIVREYLKQNKFDEIKKLVPQCTYEYLYRKDKEL